MRGFLSAEIGRGSKRRSARRRCVSAPRCSQWSTRAPRPCAHGTTGRTAKPLRPARGKAGPKASLARRGRRNSTKLRTFPAKTPGLNGASETMVRQPYRRPAPTAGCHTCNNANPCSGLPPKIGFGGRVPARGAGCRGRSDDGSMPGNGVRNFRRPGRGRGAARAPGAARRTMRRRNCGGALRKERGELPGPSR